MVPNNPRYGALATAIVAPQTAANAPFIQQTGSPSQLDVAGRTLAIIYPNKTVFSKL